MSTRRAFLKNSSLAMFGIGLGGVPGFVLKAAESFKHDNLFKKNKILVCIFQRGAMDGLMAVTPFNDNYLKEARPNLFLEAGNNHALIDLDGRFGLHPSFKPFEQLFVNKSLAIVHGLGSPNNTRSHFDAQDYMESGTPFSKSTTSGWLNRAVGLMGHDATPFRAVSLTATMPRSLYGNNDAIAMSNIKSFALQDNNPVSSINVGKSLEELYDDASSNIINATAKESFEAIKILKSTKMENYKPSNGAIYPNTDLGKSLNQIAQLIKMNVGLEIAFAEHGGWDTHFNQGKETGIFARNAADLSNSIMAFWADIEQYNDDVVIMSMTEFGRTVKQNGTGGTDHGRASCNFIVGNNIAGGKIYGSVKPLAIENLEDGRDLAVTTDFRNVFAEIATKHLKLKNNHTLFPNFDAQYLNIVINS